MTPPTMAAAIACRRMNESDLPAAHALSQGVRWPYRLEDWQLLLRLGTGFVAEENGVVIGTGLCWKQGDRHGSLGGIIVSPEHQGKGIGRRLTQRLMQELGDRCMLLNGTVTGQPLYESLGFTPIGTIHQHQGTMLAAPPVVLAQGESMRAVTANDKAKLVELANAATGMRRDELLQQLASVAQGAVLERNGELVGFSMIRRFGLGHAIGPVVAPDTERAAALILCWTETYAGSFVRLDITGTSGLGDRMAALGLVQVDTVVTMARNGVPAPDEGLEQFVVVNQSLF